MHTPVFATFLERLTRGEARRAGPTVKRDECRTHGPGTVDGRQWQPGAVAVFRIHREKPMAKLLVLYKPVADPVSFDRHYFDVHVPLAKKIPGLERYEVSSGPVSGPDGASSYHLVATLEFESMNSLQQAMGSTEGRAAAADLANFATAGADMLMFDGKEV